MKGILAALALALCTLASCSTVVSVQPVGERPANLNRIKLAGVWGPADDEEADPCAFVVKDAKNGKIIMFDRDDEYELEIRRTGKVVFANLRDDDSGHFAWAKLVLKGDTLRILAPDYDMFADLAGQQRIPAKLIQEENVDEQGNVAQGGTTVLIDDPTGKWVQDLVAGRLGNPFGDGADRLKRIRGPLR